MATPTDTPKHSLTAIRPKNCTDRFESMSTITLIGMASVVATIDRTVIFSTGSLMYGPSV
jgi:hypothetical protein